MKQVVCIFLFVLSLSCELASVADLLLLNANIVDPSSQKSSIGHILIEGEKIGNILSEVPQEFSGNKVDLTGKWVIPGLVDMHVHSWGNPSPTCEYNYEKHPECWN